MGKKTYLSADVFQMAYDRMYKEYAAGHRLVIATSGGKDSTVCLEIAVMAARDAGRLPIEVCTRDEEIMLPGTFEYLERNVYRTSEIDFHWYIARMPIVNAFSRQMPLWWTFDPLLDPEEWVRQPPGPKADIGWRGFEEIQEKHQRYMVTSKRFPVGPGTVTPDGQVGFEGQKLYSVTGIRTAESPQRLMALHSSGRAQGMDKAHLTGYDSGTGYYGLRPIYDWEDGDVWKFILDGGTGNRSNGLDYNKAYDTMYRMGVPRRNLRIAPPTMREASMKSLAIVSGAWPRWFDRVCKRCPGIRTAVQYGVRALRPERRLGESWEDVYQRAVLGPGNPEWIRARGADFIERKKAQHRTHASGPYPDTTQCPVCATEGDRHASYKDACSAMYMGDPYNLSQRTVHEMAPEEFRPGAGAWV